MFALLQFAAIWSIGLYAAPVLVPLIAIFIYQRSYSFIENVFYLSKLTAGAGALFIASLVVRGYSRVNNPVYVKFIQTLNEAHLQYNERTKQELHKYDFEFWAWPVDFDVSKLKRLDTYILLIITKLDILQLLFQFQIL